MIIETLSDLSPSYVTFLVKRDSVFYLAISNIKRTNPNKAETFKGIFSGGEWQFYQNS